MTKKQELLTYVSESVNDTNYLFCNVLYITFNEEGTKLYQASKDKLLSHLENSFDDNCVGTSGDSVIIEILS
jgi:uncharacterized protein YhbP (UPF0306 family)